MESPTTDLEVALAAAEAGAAVVRAAYGAEHVRHEKAGLDFATDADVDAERAILEVIARERPDDGRVGEESGTSGGDGPRRWLVDPICGTLNFAARTPLVAVNVALAGADGVAVSADPIAREAFWTDGTRACRRHDGTDEPLAPSSLSRLVDVNVDVPADRPFVGPQLVADAAFRASFGPRVVSSSLALAWVAAGRRAAYVTDGPVTDSVHFAAGLALCLATGCVVTDLAGDPLGTGPGLVAAADAETHARLVGLIGPHLEQVLAGRPTPPAASRG